jgi:hypothetical protein
MCILILQRDAACARAIASVLEQEIPIKLDRIRIMCSDEIADEASLVEFIANHSPPIQIILLDPHLRIGRCPSDRFGLRVYRQIALRRLNMRMLTTSFESREKVARSAEYQQFFDDEWVSEHPHVQLPFIADQMGTLLKQLISKEV